MSKRRSSEDSRLLIDVGARVRQLRESRGWTQSQLGQKVGRVHQQIQKYEAGASDPSLTMIAALAKAFDVKRPVLIEDVPLAGVAEEPVTAFEHLPADRGAEIEMDAVKAVLSGLKPVADRERLEDLIDWIVSLIQRAPSQA